jgi:chromosomal replication initiator protein
MIVADMTRPTLRTIKQAVAESCGVSVEELEGHSRRRTIAWPRQMAYWMCRHHAGKSYGVIGFHFGRRDHTTIIYGTHAFAARLSNEGDIGAETARVKEAVETLLAGEGG